MQVLLLLSLFVFSILNLSAVNSGILSLSAVVTNPTCSGANTGMIQATVSGNSGGTINYSLSPGGISNTTGTFNNLLQGSYVVTANDAGTVSTINVTLIEADTVNPNFTIPHDITVYTDNSCFVNISPLITGDVTDESDNCTTSGLQATYIDGSRVFAACQGSSAIIRTWRLTDNSGNLKTANQTIKIIDKEPPVLTIPPDLTIECGSNANPSSTGTATASDNCGGGVVVSYSDSQIAGSCGGRYVITRKWIAKDCSSNSTEAIQNITIWDSSQPIVSSPVHLDEDVSCPADIPNENIYLTRITASDNCGNTTIKLESENYEGLGADAGFCPTGVLRKYKVIDGCGNFVIVEHHVHILGKCACKLCNIDVPFHFVDFNNQPSGTWVSPSLSREGSCCGATAPDKCISFLVFLDKNAVGLILSVNSGAIPSGSLYYKVNCGPQAEVGTGICLAGGEWYTLTFCKPGNNENSYKIESISGIVKPEGLSTRVDCTGQLEVTGVNSSSVTWKDITGGGIYDRYLSCTSGCSNPIFLADSLAPSFIDYEVCGAITNSATCGSIFKDCATMRVNVFPKIDINLNVDPGNICQSNIPTIFALASPPGNYTYQWFSGYGNTGTPLSSDNSYMPATEGHYSVIVTDIQSGIVCNTFSKNFDVAFDHVGPISISPVDTLFIECSDPDNLQKIQDWLASAKASYTKIDGTVVNIIPANDFNGFNMQCNVNQKVNFTAIDDCGNPTTYYAFISVTDKTAPLLQIVGPFSYCVEQIQDAAISGNSITPAFPEYYLFHAGDTSHDLDIDLMSDNCTPVNNLEIHWRIDFSATTPATSISGTGQPSVYGSDLFFSGDGVGFTIVEHTITYWVVDQCGNESAHKSIPIYIKPRPQVVQKLTRFNQFIIPKI